VLDVEVGVVVGVVAVVEEVNSGTATGEEGRGLREGRHPMTQRSAWQT
jgi:hypothetical protein